MNRETELEGLFGKVLGILEVNPNREGLRRTPTRVAKALLELTSGYDEDPRTILSTSFEAKNDQMVIVRDIEFFSLCEHHMLPFIGTVAIGYIPNGKVVGLSKMARLVNCFARRLQIQEQMTDQIADAMFEHLRPLGVGVLISAKHLCMAMRGVGKSSETVTSALRGVMHHKPEARAEFMSLAAS